MNVRIRTPSRLHFGLLAYGRNAPRQFGGMGVMVAEPVVELMAQPGRSVRAAGPLEERAQQFAQRCYEHLSARGAGAPGKPALQVLGAAPQHVGLGVGTQLGLAVARAVTLLAGTDEVNVAELARLCGRGLRSAVGAYGFAQGGLIVEGGKTAEHRLAPLVARVELPDQWRFVLAVPQGGAGLHGNAEREAFDRLGALPQETTDALCRLVLLELLPAAVEADFAAFSEALFRFNHRVGECFATCQGGTYATRALAEAVATLRRHGVCGVGQSSWGPTLFAAAEDPEHAEYVRTLLSRQALAQAANLVVTRVCNKGAEIERAPLDIRH